MELVRAEGGGEGRVVGRIGTGRGDAKTRCLDGRLVMCILYHQMREEARASVEENVIVVL
jgi:hypothetical protein